MDPPNLEPNTCDSKKYTPPLSTLHLSQIPTAESTDTNATHTKQKQIFFKTTEKLIIFKKMT